MRTLLFETFLKLLPALFEQELSGCVFFKLEILSLSGFVWGGAAVVCDGTCNMHLGTFAVTSCSTFKRRVCEIDLCLSRERTSLRLTCMGASPMWRSVVPSFTNPFFLAVVIGMEWSQKNSIVCVHLHLPCLHHMICSFWEVERPV